MNQKPITEKHPSLGLKLTMKRIVYTPIIVMAGVLTGCNGAKANAPEMKVPEFPYQEYLDESDDNDGFPSIGDDGHGFNAISHKIRYPEMPDSLSGSLFADSLLQFYNVVSAFNTIAYDVSTAERYMDESDFGLSQADALDSINVSGIKDPAIREALVKVSTMSAKWLRAGEKPNEQQNDEVREFYDVFNVFRQPMFENHLSDDEFNPTEIVEDYAAIHAKAITDSTCFRNELLQRVLQETDFGKKCVLAREFAYANYSNPNRDDKELVAVIDPILRANEYSPLLGELWLMWRSALQMHLFGGSSNDSAMYNLFYNDMRNRIAMVYISHLSAHPQDKLAFNEFAKLATEYNIIRNGPFPYGNNALLDDMSLYEEIWSKK